MTNTILEIVDDWFINLSVYFSMLLGLARRNPKIVLIGSLIVYGIVSIILVWHRMGNKPLLSLTALIALFIGLYLIVFYKKAEPTQERALPDVLSTKPSWFDDIELKR